jgi:LPXTG-motif cell wall-anchored protein
MFRQTETQSGWAIVQIYSNDGASLVTTILAYPNPKVASNGQNVVVYPANGSGSIPAIEGFVFSGDSTVQQLAYPKAIADEIGIANHTRIPTTGTDDAYPRALPDAASSWSAPVASGSDSGSTMTAQNNATTRQENLPQTASPLPLLALVGLSSIAGIVILRKARRRSTL